VREKILNIRKYFNSDWIIKEDVVDILMVFISNEHLNTLNNLIQSGYSLEEIKDMEVYKNE